MEKLFTTLGQRLKYLRNKRRLQQWQVADRLGLGRSTYNQYENDKREPDVELLARIAEFYGVSADFLLGLSDDPSPRRELEEKIAQMSNHRSDDPLSELPEDARKSLEEFIRKMVEKYGTKRGT